METKTTKKGQRAIRYGQNGQEIKTGVTFKIESSIWNEAMEKADELGINLNYYLRQSLIAFNKDMTITINTVEVKPKI